MCYYQDWILNGLMIRADNIRGGTLMIRRSRVSLLACLLVFGLSTCAALAQEPEPGPSAPADPPPMFGAAFSLNYPYENFGEEHETGYGIHAIMIYPFIPLLDFTADIGWNRFPQADDGEAIDVWEFAGGMRFVMGVFFMSGEVGYYTEVEDTSFVPGLGLRFDRLEISLRVKAVTGGSWTGLRVGYYF